MIKRLLYTAIFIFSVGVIPSYEIDAKAESASDVVKSFQFTLLHVMKTANSTSVQQRYDKLAPAISQHFHIPLMTRIATGQHWSKSQPSEKAAAIAAFKRMNVATLATLFDDYNGEKFQLEDESPGPSRTTIVSTHLVKPNKSKIKIAYVAGNFNGAWRLIDVVVASGISELRVRRSEYHLILNKSGLSGLIRLLNSKADDLMSY